MKISVVINTYNAAEFLDRVLDSVKYFDEILICDMYSTDDTLKIASKYNCRVIYHNYTGIVEPARAFAISQASHDWVLLIDADEIVTPNLRNYLYKKIGDTNDNFAAIRIPRKNYFMGRFLYSAYPNALLRFFRRGSVNWPTVIHAHPAINGSIATIPSSRRDLALIHLANESIETSIRKMNIYTDFETKRRGDKKYGYLSLIFEPLFRFLHFYIFKCGFRDGTPGLIWASMNAYYKFITIAKVIELRVRKEDYDKDLL